LVSTEEGFLHVSVDDNGKGFDPDKKRKGIGISNMMNRVESFNGELKIESSPGNGCKLTIKIPC
jgi:two-component system sensor histidine kinase UhpB